MKFLPSLLLLAFSAATHAAIIQLDLQGKAGFGLLAGNENGIVTGSFGSGGEIGGGIFFDNVSKVLTVNVGWGSGNGFADLTGAATGSHIHGPAGFLANNIVVFSLARADSTASAGFISTSTPALSAAQETDLLNGLYYINIHTSTNGGGEIRGNLVVVPEPSSVAIGALGLLGLFRRRR